MNLLPIIPGQVWRMASGELTILAQLESERGPRTRVAWADGRIDVLEAATVHRLLAGARLVSGPRDWREWPERIGVAAPVETPGMFALAPGTQSP